MLATTLTLCLAANHGQLLLKSLTYVNGSSAKQEQIIGDVDWQDRSISTKSQTLTRANVLGCGLGYSFEANGRLLFLFGDTIGATPPYVPNWATKVNPFLWKAHDPLAWANPSGPDNLVLDFVLNSPGQALEVQPVFPNGHKVNLGENDIPASGVEVGNKIYILCTSGCVTKGGKGDYSHAFSVLTTFDGSRNFRAIRKFSQLRRGALRDDIAHRRRQRGLRLWGWRISQQ
jgi:hypothetical protein